MNPNFQFNILNVLLIIVTIIVNFCNDIEQKEKFMKANILYIYKSIKYGAKIKDGVLITTTSKIEVTA